MKRLVLIVLYLPIVLFAEEIVWEKEIGPWGGNIVNMTIDKNNGIYALSQSNGLYKSSDNGGTWENIFYSDTIDTYDEVKIDTDGRIFINSPSKGFFYSENGGDSWNLIPFMDVPVTMINTFHIVDGGILVCAGAKGMFFTSDFGSSWEVINEGNDFKQGITLSTGKDGTLWYASLKQIYKSSDFGKTWSFVDSVTSTNNIRCFYFRNNGDMLIGTDKFIRYSTDGYLTFQDFNDGLLDQGAQAICEMPNGEFLAGSRLSLFRSKDTCKTWEKISIHYDMVRVSSIISASDNRMLISTGPTGVYFSDDYGDTWDNPNIGMNALTVSAIFITKDNKIYAGTNTDGIFLSDNGGKWQHIYKYQNVSDIFVNDSGFIFVATARIGMQWTTDNGYIWDTKWAPAYRACFNLTVDPNGDIYGASAQRLWVSKNSGHSFDEIVLDTTFRDMKQFEILPNGNFYIMLTRGYLRRSFDKGVTWDSVSLPWGNRVLNYLAFGRSGDIFLAIDSIGVAKSTDGGENWEVVLNYSKVNSIYNNQKGGVVACTRTGVHVSYNEGDEWQVSNTGLKYKNVFTATKDINNKLYAGTNGGVYQGSVFTGIEQEENINKQDDEIIIFPNPASDIISIQAHRNNFSNASFEIIDLLGNCVYSQNIPIDTNYNSIEIDCSSFPNGFYICLIRNGNKVISEKLNIIR